MHRVLVVLLAALDAVLAAAGGIAMVLAPLALVWVVALGSPDWSALWPTTAAVWHLGHLVPLEVTLPDAYLATTGIDPSSARFTLSLAPLALAAFTGLFAARSGRRAAEAGAPLTGWLSGSIVFAAVATLVALTSGADLVASETWQGIVFPTLIFAVPSLLGAFVTAWRIGDDGAVDALRARVDDLPAAWAPVLPLTLRGVGITTLGLVGVGALVVVAGLIGRSTQVISLYQSSNADAAGATAIALGQLVYLPTLVLWGLSFAAGPGFAVGIGTSVTPAATQVGVLPGIPVLGAVPESTTVWLLLLALLPVGVGALAGWILHGHLPAVADPEPIAPRLVLTLSVAVLTGGVGALAAVVSHGSIGPGRLADVGPEPGPLALALGLEVLVGLAVVLLSPRPGAAPDGPAVPRRERRPAPVLASPMDHHEPDAAPAAPQEGSGIATHVDGWGAAPGSSEPAPDGEVDDEVRARIRDAWSRPAPLPGEWGHDDDGGRR